MHKVEPTARQLHELLGQMLHGENGPRITRTQLQAFIDSPKQPTLEVLPTLFLMTIKYGATLDRLLEDTNLIVSGHPQLEMTPCFERGVSIRLVHARDLCDANEVHDFMAKKKLRPAKAVEFITFAVSIMKEPFVVGKFIGSSAGSFEHWITRDGSGINFINSPTIFQINSLFVAIAID